jgi:hypothetical protein
MTVDRPFVFSGVGGTWQLQSAFTSGATRTVTLTAGTLDLNGYTLTTGIFGGAGSLVRRLVTNSVPIIVIGNAATVVSFGTTTNFTTDVTPVLNLTYSGSVGTRSISFGATGATVVSSFNINVTAGSDIVTTTGTTTIRNLTFTSGFTGTLNNVAREIYGNLTLTSGMIVASGANATTFNGVGSQTITTAGLTLDFPLTFNGVGGTWTLQDALTSGATRTATLTNGTLNLNSLTLTTGFFSSSGSNARTIAFGSTGKMDLTGTGATVFTTSVATSLTVTGTDPLIRLTTNSTTGTRGIIFGAAGEANSISVDVIAGSDQINLSTTSGAYRNVNFTGFTGTVSFQNSILIFGNWNFGGVTSTIGSGTATFAATSGTKTITSNGDSFPGGVTFNGVGGAWTLQDALSTSATIALTNGTLNLGGYTVTCTNFASNNSNTRALNFGSTGSIAVTGNNATVWSCSDLTNFSYTGTPTVNFTYSGSVGTRTINNGQTGATELNVVDFNVTAGSDQWTATANNSVRNLNFTGFSGTTGLFGAGFIYGNLILSPTQTITSSTSATTFAATSGTKTITTNGVTIDRQLVFSGIGGTWQLGSALTLGATNGNIRQWAGTLTTNNYALTFTDYKAQASTAVGNRTLNLGSSAVTLLGSSLNAAWQAEDGAYALTINAGTSTIYLAEAFTGATRQDFYGGGKTYYNVVYSGGQPGGFYNSSTFNSISNTAQPLALVFEAGTTQTVNNFNVSGTAGNLVTMTSTTPGTQWNLVKATGSKVVVSFCSITDSNVTPTPGYWFAPTSQGNVDGGNNTGWNFGSAGDNSSFMLLM